MEKTFDTFSGLLFFSQLITIVLCIAIIILGSMLVVKLLKLMDSQTALNKERIKKLREGNSQH